MHAGGFGPSPPSRLSSPSDDGDPAMSSLIPPQPPATWTHTPEQVTTLINELIVKGRAFWDKIGSLPAEECTFESVHPPFSISLCEDVGEERLLNGRAILIGLR